MPHLFLAMLLAFIPSLGLADALLATRAIPSRCVGGPEDVGIVEREIPGALSKPEEAIGLEARVTVYAGRAIRASDLGPPALVERNQIVTLRFRSLGLSIATEGRALARAGLGERIQVMNLTSKTVVTGLVLADRSVEVTP